MQEEKLTEQVDVNAASGKKCGDDDALQGCLPTFRASYRREVRRSVSRRTVLFSIVFVFIFCLFRSLTERKTLTWQIKMMDEGIDVWDTMWKILGFVGLILLAWFVCLFLKSGRLARRDLCEKFSETAKQAGMDPALIRRRTRREVVLGKLCGVLAAIAFFGVVCGADLYIRYPNIIAYRTMMERIDAGDYAGASRAFYEIDGKYDPVFAERMVRFLDAHALCYYCESREAFQKGNVPDAVYDMHSAYDLGFNWQDDAHKDIISAYKKMLDEELPKYKKRQETAAQRELDKKIRSGVPFVGMPEDRIGDTTLGEPSPNVRHNSVGNGQNANLYDFKNKYGKTIFTARCVRGKVTEVWDIRAEAARDPYPSPPESFYVYEPEVDDFDDPEDFYDYYYDDFYDYYDARDYYYEHGGR